MEFFDGGGSEVVFAEVTQKLTCIAFSTGRYRDVLLKDSEFLFILAKSLTNIIDKITMQNASLPSLQERAYSYMLYKCEDQRLKGVVPMSCADISFYRNEIYKSIRLPV